ncbi:heme ABC transporter ATPase [Desulfosarcina widdelii]|uniref:ATP-binding protein Uup n=1 Tax=Desulfosarcina widdelii TaxID=947919 RepID=A0A5K7Z1M4_9BACT|nr:ATP-binding cassette domain-containing protein [Desulfosarcina widdelii]BBO74003.1 heme ABC transporter ATPase [Desulfosarcina widdelii]
MALITLRDVCVSFGVQPLLDRVNLTVQPGERICLLGRNGVGKSTLMDVIAGRLVPDRGEVMRTQGGIVGSLAQQVPETMHGTVLDAIFSAIGPRGEHLAAYRQLGQKSESGDGLQSAVEQRRVALQQAIDEEGGWEIQQRAEQIASRLHLPMDTPVHAFSAGMKRQVLLAAALAVAPDILLLDEPTNHLDMAAIEWLETFLIKWGGTLMMVTHDRMMIRRLATRILEIDRGCLYSWDCGYDTYLQRNQERLESEEKDNRRFDKKLSAEEAWIRQGIKARRTRNEGRVRALEQLREARRARRDRTGRVRMSLDLAGQSGKRVVEATDLAFRFGEKTIVEDFSCTIMRGDRIGILGPNGAGKTTLIRLLLGELEADRGRIKHGTNLEVCYFDQLRGQLDEEKTVQQNLSPDSDMLDIGGRQRHVIGYLKDFLFSPERARTPVRVLSGGEKNRLLLAKLFARPANVLVLDEPTNDLDVETLELLEELLLDYAGTVLLVSHDRAFINNVVTSTLVFESPGRVEAYAGGYDDWLDQRPEVEQQRTKKAGAKNGRKSTAPVTAPKKLGYMQQRELDGLPGRIESLESRQEELFQIMSREDFYRQDGRRIAEVKQELAEVEQELERAFARWEELESMNG